MSKVTGSTVVQTKPVKNRHQKAGCASKEPFLPCFLLRLVCLCKRNLRVVWCLSDVSSLLMRLCFSYTWRLISL